jgi:hypothetical protein
MKIGNTEIQFFVKSVKDIHFEQWLIYVYNAAFLGCVIAAVLFTPSNTTIALLIYANFFQLLVRSVNYVNLLRAHKRLQELEEYNEARAKVSEELTEASEELAARNKSRLAVIYKLNTEQANLECQIYDLKKELEILTNRLNIAQGGVVQESFAQEDASE